MRLLEAIHLIAQELERAEEKHPKFPTDPIHAVAILVEESGEAMQAALDLTYGGEHADKLKTELIHAGAMAVRNLMNFHRFQTVKSYQK